MADRDGLDDFPSLRIGDIALICPLLALENKTTSFLHTADFEVHIIVSLGKTPVRGTLVLSIRVTPCSVL
ncbi:MAG: hypothetical protein PHP34_10870 [Bacteroidales bacterium]|nr:hypothetical protein [Bacteroidales bacterium]